MITVDHPVPAGVLSDETAALLDPALAASQGFWWHGDGLQTDAAGRVTAWTARHGPRSAKTVEPAEANATEGAAGDVAGLQCRPGLHCGMMVEDVSLDSRSVSMGIRYLPPERDSARTVLTYRAEGRTPAEENYLFLSESDGQLKLADDRDRLELLIDLPDTGGFRTLLVSMTPQRAWLRILGGETHEAAIGTALLTGVASLMIGCRSPRGRLKSTLGGALIADVWLWPGRDISQAQSLLTAFDRFHLWSGDSP